LTLAGCISAFNKPLPKQRDDFPKIVLKEIRSPPISVVSAKNDGIAAQLSDDVKQMLAMQAKFASTQSERESEKLKRQIVTADSRIDHLAYQLYELTEQQVALVEKSEVAAEDVQAA
jgi:hypothetical protein